MAVFTKSEIDARWHIWQMFRDGAIALVNCESLLDEIVEDLADADYVVHVCDAASGNKVAFEKAIRSSLGFPDGRPGKTNLDALNGYVGDIEFPNRTGIVVVVKHIHQLHEAEANYVNHIIDIFAREAWYHLCFGNRLMLILHTDDPDIQFGSVASRQPVRVQRILGAKNPVAIPSNPNTA